ncbi:hypothetical protein [Enterococcus sp.]|jgi:hypothetical protein|uniref:hypothetical protein n=1 Tax=Enterococcus sp. TaxID=35783 RepID=UPI0025BC91D0|nr:hypothetical protein [Enterococcus sp.]
MEKSKPFTKCTLRQRYTYYRQQNAHQQYQGNFKNDFQKDFPSFANWLKLQQKPTTNDQTATFSHWFLLILFSLLTVATFTQQLLFLLLVFVIAALVKGPGMILLGVLYSFLVTLFPPLGLLFSALFFLLTLKQLTRNVTFIFTAMYFYSYPFLITAIHHFTAWDDRWIMIAAVVFALISGHLLFKKNYPTASSKAFAWRLLTAPYDCLTVLLPSKKGRRLQKFSRIK